MTLKSSKKTKPKNSIGRLRSCKLLNDNKKRAIKLKSILWASS
jgi:hypothetical protein